MNNDDMGIYSFLQPVADLISGVITALYDVTVAIGISKLCIGNHYDFHSAENYFVSFDGRNR